MRTIQGHVPFVLFVVSLATATALMAPGDPTLVEGGTPLNPGTVARLSEIFVNDNEGEVDSADVADGSLTGADVSTSGGDVVFADGSLVVNAANQGQSAITGAGASASDTLSDGDGEPAGDGIVGQGGTGINVDGGVGVIALGGGSPVGQGGIGLIARGGGVDDVEFEGGDGIHANGGAGVASSGHGVVAEGAPNPHNEPAGDGVRATGGLGGPAGRGIVAQGGNGDISDGGSGTVSTGGNALPLGGRGGAGVEGFGGDGAPFTLGSDGFNLGGNGVEGTGGSPDGIGVVGTPAAVAGLGVLSQGDLGVSGTLRSIQPHPTDAGTEIRMAAAVGNEVGTYFRGTGLIVDGQAVIRPPEEFQLVSAEDGLTVHLTPIGAPALLWVGTQALDGIVVHGSDDVQFHYVVHGLRRGFEQTASMAPNQTFVPSARGVPYGAQFTEQYRRILVENGTLNADFTPNEGTAARQGWRLDQR